MQFWQRTTVALLLGIAPGATLAHAQDSVLVYFGSRTEGPGHGITAARFDPQTGALSDLGLVAEVPSATWVMPGPAKGTVLAGSEYDNKGTEDSSVFSFAADPATGKLTPVAKVDAGGRGATHLVYNAKPAALFVANYASGQVSVLPVGPGAALKPATSVVPTYGFGPSPRQATAHAHGVAIAPGGRAILVPDLGADRIFVERFDPATLTLSPAPVPFVAARPGTGPRHVVFHPNGRIVYVNGELSGDLTTYRWDAATTTLTPLGTISTFAPGFGGSRSGGEIALSPDGHYLYVTNRGEESIAVYGVDPQSGALNEVQRLPAGGKQPWAFSFDGSGKWLLVANQASDKVTVFRRDPASGQLTATDQALTVAGVSSVAVLPR
jgi:6-phosphogluconolactonase